MARIRLRNLNSQSNRDQLLRNVVITPGASRPCLEPKAGRVAVNESTDYVCKVKRALDISYKVTVGGF